jgi:hypothetical protein
MISRSRVRHEQKRRTNFMNTVQTRKSRGVIAVLISGLALILIMFGFFATEVWYAHLTTVHLKNCCDSAAMAAAASLVSAKGESKPEEEGGRKKARALALELLRRSSAGGYSLDKIEESSDISHVTALKPKEAVVSIKFVDEHSVESTKGKHVQVRSALQLPAFSGNLLGFNSYLLQAMGRSGAAKLDLAFCLDNSLSMSTDTPVTLVRRQWDHETGRIKYISVASDIAKRITAYASIEPLQMLSSYKHRKFDGTLRTNKVTDVGVKPGNSEDPGYPIDTLSFTDRIINVDNSEFSDMRIAVEAARGNLENKEVYINSGAKETFDALGIGVEPHEGYKVAYEKVAFEEVKPFAQAKSEIKKFFQMMENNTDSHFGLIPFSHHASRGEDDQMNDWKIALEYKPGGTFKYPFARVPLAQRESQFDRVISTIDKYRLHGGTATPSAIYAAIELLSDASRTRPDARKIMLLFTDGEPTQSVDGDDPVTSCFKAADQARKKGIPIYAVGFLHDGNVVKAKATLEGIAKRGGAGGKAFIVQDAEQLNETLRILARELITLE